MIGSIARKIILLTILGAVSYFGYTTYLDFTSKPGEDFRPTVKVQKADIVQKVSVAGHIFSARMTQVKAPFEGYVDKVFVKIGDTVKKGDALISVVETLNVVGQEVFPIRAPFPGKVTQVSASTGQNVSKDANATPLLRVDDLSRMYVYADVAELDYIHIQTGLQALVKAPAILNKSYRAEVLEFALAPNSQSNWSRDKVEYSVKLEILDPDLKLKPGMSVIADIAVAERKDVLSVSLDFVERGDHDDYFVTKANGERVEVKVGVQDDSRVEILEGLKEGDQIKQIDFLSGE